MTHLAHFATERALAPVAPIPSLDTAAAILSVAERCSPIWRRVSRSMRCACALRWSASLAALTRPALGLEAGLLKRARQRWSCSCGSSAVRSWPGRARPRLCCRFLPRCPAFCRPIRGGLKRWSGSSNSRHRCPWAGGTGCSTDHRARSCAGALGRDRASGDPRRDRGRQPRAERAGRNPRRSSASPVPGPSGHHLRRRPDRRSSRRGGCARASS